MLISKALEGFFLDYAIESAPGTVRLAQLYLGIWLHWIGDRDISTVQLADLQRYLVWLRTEYRPHRVPASPHHTEPLGPAAIDNHWKVLRSFFGWASMTLSIPNITVALTRARYEDPEITPYSSVEITALLKTATWYQAIRGDRQVTCKRPDARRNRAMILLFLDTGIRIGEMARLRIADVHFDASEIFITPYHTGKKTKSRSIPMGKHCRLAIWQFLSARADLDPADSLLSMRQARIGVLLFDLGRVAGVADVHAHRFRHTFAIEYLRNGGDPFTLQRILGHATLDMVKRYLNIVQSDLQSAHRRASPVDHWAL